MFVLFKCRNYINYCLVKDEEFTSFVELILKRTKNVFLRRAKMKNVKNLNK
jgi:hypothetical protein